MKTRHMRTLFTLMTGLSFLFLLTTGCKKKSERNVIKIGAILPLTGPGAEFGVANKHGITMAIEELNSKGGVANTQLKAIFVDSQNSPKVSITEFNKLLVTNHPDVLFVSMSSISMALKPMIEKEHLTSICVAAAPDLTSSSHYIFRFLPTTQYQAKVLAQLLQDKINKKIGVFYIQDDFGFSFEQSFKGQAKAQHLNIIFGHSFPKNGKDFRSIISKALKDKPDIIVLGGYGTALGLLIKQLRNFGYKGALYGTPEMGYSRVTKIVGKEMGEAYVIDFNVDYSTSQMKNFFAEYKKRFGTKPTLDALLGFDGIQLIARAYDNYIRNKLPSLRDGLVKLKHFNGLIGLVNIDENGDIEIPLKTRKLIVK